MTPYDSVEPTKPGKKAPLFTKGAGKDMPAAKRLAALKGKLGAKAKFTKGLFGKKEK